MNHSKEEVEIPSRDSAKLPSYGLAQCTDIISMPLCSPFIFILQARVVLFAQERTHFGSFTCSLHAKYTLRNKKSIIAPLVLQRLVTKGKIKGSTLEVRYLFVPLWFVPYTFQS